MKAELRILSDLEKVFPAKAPAPLTEPLSMLQTERLSFQAAVHLDYERNGAVAYSQGRHLRLKVQTDLPLRVYQVGLVPCRLTAIATADGNYLQNGPGLFPDPLFPLSKDENGFYAFDSILGQWSSLLLEADLRSGAPFPAGDYPVKLSLFAESDPETPLARAEAFVHVYGASLLPQKLRYTCWLHGDCLADYYRVPVFSEEHWAAMESFIQKAASYGQNVLLTPLFTPPLDTAMGGERTTIQLVDVSVIPDKEGGAPSYAFVFSKLERFIKMAQQAGIEFFEMSHLFTQWGGKACPKIMATITDPASKDDYEYKQIFGWNTEALSPEYTHFLEAFLPALTQELNRLGLQKNAYFHLTDEPHKDHLPQYLALKNLVAPLVEGYPIMDAMSDYDYYEQGVTRCPVVATSALAPFLSADPRPEEFWVYYCVGQGTHNLSNRFFDMPGWRTRVLGVQLYKEKVAGFLQWGLNFYNTQHSLKHIDPFTVTDAGGFFPGGDSFILYPGPQQEALGSLRLHEFHDGLQDLRALQTLESLTSRSYVLSLLEEGLPEPISFTNYPTGESWLLSLRSRINREIAEKA